MAFEKSTTGINLIIAWDAVRVNMPFNIQ